MLTCNADITTIVRNKDQDDMLVIACDGIWDCLSNQNCVNMFRRLMFEKEDGYCSYYNERMFDKIVAKSLQASNGIGTDNMSCILVKFKAVNEQRKALKNTLNLPEPMDIESGYTRNLTPELK